MLVVEATGTSLKLQQFPPVIYIPESQAKNGDSVWKFVVIDDDDDAFTSCTLAGTDAAEFSETLDAALGCAITFNGDKDFDAGDESFEFEVL